MGMEPDFDLLWQDKKFTFSSQENFTLEYIPPLASLTPYIATFFKFHAHGKIIRDVQPANTGHMMVFLSGQGEARFLDGHVDKSQPITIIGPTNAAMPYVVQGPFICFGCSFSPTGWRAITGLNAAQSSDRFADSETVFGPECSEFYAQLKTIAENYEGAAQHQMMANAATEFFLPRLRRINPKHQAIIDKTIKWLDNSLTPDLEALYAELPVTPRQAQRIIGDYFSCAPKPLMRKFRAVRAAMLLNNPGCTDEQAADVLNLFSDQPHMIREIRHFAGRTPSRLSGEDSDLLTMWLDCPSSESLKTIVGKQQFPKVRS